MVTLTVVIEGTTCGVCGVPFGLEVNYHKRVIERGDGFYCPNGHSISYSKTENERLRQELQRAQDATARAEARERRERERANHEEMRVRGYKGALAKTKRRIAAGACPQCHAEFPDLASHMAAQHPLYGQKA